MSNSRLELLLYCNFEKGMSGSPVMMRDDEDEVWLSGVHTTAHNVNGIKVNSVVLLNGPNYQFVVGHAV